MKILEINGFMRWAKNYEGSHSLLRWLPIKRFLSSNKNSDIKGLISGLILLTKVKNLELDFIVCCAFGRAYDKGLLYRSCKAFKESLLIRIICAIKKKSGVPMAVIDLADDPTIHPVNKPLLDSVDIYFKRELPLDPYHVFESLRGRFNRAGTEKNRRLINNNNWVAKLQPISLGCRQVQPSGNIIPAEQKKYDVFYVGNADNKPRRLGLHEALMNLRERGYKVHMPEELLSIEDYLEAIKDSRLALSPPGLGWDCHRHYEAAFSGTVAVMPAPVIQRYEPLLGGEHCLFYDQEKDLTLQLIGMLENNQLLDKIATQAYSHSFKYQTHEKIFASVIERLGLIQKHISL
ncbi:MAG: hypothetical protein ACSHX0_01160 [Akkermansiaceae bacterium]